MFLSRTLTNPHDTLFDRIFRIFGSNIFKAVVSLNSQPKVRFREYLVYFLMGKNSLKNQPFRRCWEHWFYISIIPKSYKKINERKKFNKKTGNVTFFQPNLICQFVRTHEFFSDFFLNFENPIYGKMFESYLPIVSIDLSKLKKNFED